MKCRLLGHFAKYCKTKDSTKVQRVRELTNDIDEIESNSSSEESDTFLFLYEDQTQTTL